MDDADRLRLRAVAQDDLAAGRAGGVDQALDLQRGVDVRVGRRSRSAESLGGSKVLKPVARMMVPTLISLISSCLREVDRLPVAAGLDAGLLALARS